MTGHVSLMALWINGEHRPPHEIPWRQWLILISVSDPIIPLLCIDPFDLRAQVGVDCGVTCTSSQQLHDDEQ